MSFDDIRKKLDFEGARDMDSDVASENGAASAGSPPPEVIAAYLRVRPFTSEDSARGYQKRPIEILNRNTVSVGSLPRESRLGSRKGPGKAAMAAAENGHMVTTFTFSEVFGETCSQQTVFDTSILPMVRNFLAGHDSLVFAHGITNSGKTYTMQGNAKEPGMIPRSLAHIFGSLEGKLYTGTDLKPNMFADVARLSPKEAAAELATKTAILCTEKQAHDSTLLSQTLQLSSHSQSSLSDSDDTDVAADVTSANSALRPTTKEATKYSVWLSFAEIYKEQMFDLLEPGHGCSKASFRRKPLKMAEDRQGQPYIKDLRSVCVSSAEEASRLIAVGQKNLQYACTRLNENSSRSHCVLTLRLLHVVECDEDSDDSSVSGVDAKFHVSRVNLISFCDLAGSERTNRTDNVGERLKEASNINASLFTLGRCISAMRDLALQQQQQGRARAPGSIVVPFRASKLTRLFQNFFCGKGKVCMFVNVSQCNGDYDENIHALKFSAIAQKAAFVPVVPEFKVPPPKRQKSERPLSLAAKFSLDPRSSIAWATPGTIRALGEVGQRVSSLIPQEVLEVRDQEGHGWQQQQPSATAADLVPAEAQSENEDAGSCTEALSNDGGRSSAVDQAADESDDEHYDFLLKFYGQRETQFRKAIEELTVALVAAREELKEARAAAEAREKCVREEVCAAWKADIERLEEEHRSRLDKELEGARQLMDQKVELIEDFVQKSAMKRGRWQLRRTSGSGCDSSDDEEGATDGSPRPKLLRPEEDKENRRSVSVRVSTEKLLHERPVLEESAAPADECDKAAHEGTAISAAAAAVDGAGGERRPYRIRRSVLDGLAVPPGVNGSDAEWRAFAAILEARLRCREDDLCHTRRRLEEALAATSSEECRRAAAEQSLAASKCLLEHSDRKQLAYEQELSRLRRLAEHQRSLLSTLQQRQSTCEGLASAVAAAPVEGSSGVIHDPSSSTDATAACSSVELALNEQTTAVPTFFSRQPVAEAEVQTDPDCLSASTNRLVKDLEGEVTALTHGLRACESWREATERQLAAEIVSSRQAALRLAEAEDRLREIEQQLATRDEASAAAEGRAAAAQSALIETAADRDRLLAECSRLKAERDAALRARAEADGTRMLQKIREQDQLMARQELLMRQATERINFLTDELARRMELIKKLELAARHDSCVAQEPQRSPNEVAGDATNVAVGLPDVSTSGHSDEHPPAAVTSTTVTSGADLEAPAAPAGTSTYSRALSSAPGDPELLSFTSSNTGVSAVAIVSGTCGVNSPCLAEADTVSDATLSQLASVGEQRFAEVEQIVAAGEQQLTPELQYRAVADQYDAAQLQQSELAASMQCESELDSEPQEPMSGQPASPDCPERDENEALVLHEQPPTKADERRPVVATDTTCANGSHDAPEACQHLLDSTSAAVAATAQMEREAACLRPSGGPQVAPCSPIGARHVDAISVASMVPAAASALSECVQQQQQSQSPGTSPPVLLHAAVSDPDCPSLSLAPSRGIHELTAASSPLRPQLCDAATDPPSPLKLGIAASASLVSSASHSVSQAIEDKPAEPLEPEAQQCCCHCGHQQDVEKNTAVTQTFEVSPSGSDNGSRVSLGVQVNEVVSPVSAAPVPELEALKMALAEQESTMSQQDTVISRLEEDLAATRRISENSAAECRALTSALEEARCHLAELQAAAAAARPAAAAAEVSHTVTRPVSTQTSPAADPSCRANAKGLRSSQGAACVSSDRSSADNEAENPSPCQQRHHELRQTAGSKPTQDHAEASGFPDAQADVSWHNERESDFRPVVDLQLKQAVVKLPKLSLQSALRLADDNERIMCSAHEERDVTPDVLRRKRQKLAATSARKKSSRTSNVGSCRKKKSLASIGSPSAGEISDAAATPLPAGAAGLSLSDATPAVGDFSRRPSRACKASARSKIATIIELSTSPLQTVVKSARKTVVRLTTTPGSHVAGAATQSNRKTPGGATTESPSASASDGGTPECSSMFANLMKATVQGGRRKRHLMSDSNALLESPEDELRTRKAKPKVRKPADAHMLLHRALRRKTGVLAIDDDL